MSKPLPGIDYYASEADMAEHFDPFRDDMQRTRGRHYDAPPRDECQCTPATYWEPASICGACEARLEARLEAEERSVLAQSSKKVGSTALCDQCGVQIIRRESEWAHFNGPDDDSLPCALPLRPK